MSHTLYIYRDEYRVVLYVGVTSRGLARSHEHVESAPWWPYVASAEFTHWPTREAVLEREAEAIRRYRPAFNVLHNIGHEQMREHYLAARQAAAGALADYQGQGPLSFDPTDLDPRAVRHLLKVEPHRIAVLDTKARSVEVTPDSIDITPEVPVPAGLYRLTGGIGGAIRAPWRVVALRSPAEQ